MSTFNDHLLQIHEEISIKNEDRKPYIEMFDLVRDWLMHEMCACPLFKELYKGTELFGSYSNRVRIIKPSEFDISILLEFNNSINVDIYAGRPGFVKISKNTNIQLSEQYNKLFCGNRLSRTRLQKWMKTTIGSVLSERPTPNGYMIKYSGCKTAHNIYVQETKFPYKTISIDFVPTILMCNHSIVPLAEKMRMNVKTEYLKTFVAIPNYLIGCGPRNRKGDTFQLVNPSAERKIMWDKQNLKVVYRLLKSLRDQQELPRLKSYFFTAIFLLEVDKQPADFWHKPIADIFLHMLKQLIGYFKGHFLPFYWNRAHDLLALLKLEEITNYTNILSHIFSKLESISVQTSPTYSTVASFFKTSL